jgi:hypothetical protein
VKPGAYCKVFVERNSGDISFLKDGYTDLQGRFRYIDSCDGEFDKIAILATTEKGGVIIEAE